MSECQFSSFYTFLMEPMIELEPERYTFSASSIISPQKLPPDIAGPVESTIAYRIGNDEKDRRQLAPDSEPSVKKYRTRFSPKQKLELENAFYRTPYPSATLRAQLANSLGVTPSVVMNWFKKRRYRWRQKSPNLGMPVPCSCVLPPFQSQTQNRPSQPAYTQGTVFGYHETMDAHRFQQALVDNQKRENEVGNIYQRVIQFNP